MVLQDLTVAMISSGSRSIVLRRHRATQTLFVSKVISAERNSNAPFLPLMAVGMIYRALCDVKEASRVSSSTASKESVKSSAHQGPPERDGQPLNTATMSGAADSTPHNLHQVVSYLLSHAR